MEAWAADISLSFRRTDLFKALPFYAGVVTSECQPTTATLPHGHAHAHAHALTATPSYELRSAHCHPLLPPCAVLSCYPVFLAPMYLGFMYFRSFDMSVTEFRHIIPAATVGGASRR